MIHNVLTLFIVYFERSCQTVFYLFISNLFYKRDDCLEGKANNTVQKIIIYQKIIAGKVTFFS